LATADELCRIVVECRQEVDAMQRILVGVDGSTASRRALHWAADLAARAALELDAIMVLGSLHDGVGTVGDPALECARQLEEWCAGLPARCVHRVAVVADGDPASLLLEESAQRDAELLVVASRGAGEVGGLHVGTVVHRLAHRVAIPLAIVGPTAMVTTSRLVVGNHPRTGNPAALAFTAELAHRMAIPVTAVYTFDPHSGEDADVDVEEWHRRARAEVHAWSTPLEEAGADVECYVDRVRDVDPVAALEHVLLDYPGSVAVVGVRGSDGWGTGRVPLGLARHSHHAVILVPDTADLHRFAAEAAGSGSPTL
jgi:nucleotide-binding universal stress UspA family protein